MIRYLIWIGRKRPVLYVPGKNTISYIVPVWKIQESRTTLESRIRLCCFITKACSNKQTVNVTSPPFGDRLGRTENSLPAPLGVWLCITVNFLQHTATFIYHYCGTLSTPGKNFIEINRYPFMSSYINFFTSQFSSEELLEEVWVRTDLLWWIWDKMGLHRHQKRTVDITLPKACCLLIRSVDPKPHKLPSERRLVRTSWLVIIYNFDEIGFAIGLTATAKVITRADIGGRRCPLL